MDGTVKSIVQDAVVFLTGCERSAFSGETKGDQEAGSIRPTAGVDDER